MPNMPNSVWVPSAKSSPLYSLAEEPPSVRENDLRFAISHFGHEFVTEAMQYGRASPSRGASGILQDVFEGNDSRLAMPHPPDDKASELATAWAMVMSVPDDFIYRLTGVTLLISRLRLHQLVGIISKEIGFRGRKVMSVLLRTH